MVRVLASPGCHAEHLVPAAAACRPRARRADGRWAERTQKHQQLHRCLRWPRMPAERCEWEEPEGSGTSAAHAMAADLADTAGSRSRPTPSPKEGILVFEGHVYKHRDAVAIQRRHLGCQVGHRVQHNAGTPACCLQHLRPATGNGSGATASVSPSDLADARSHRVQKPSAARAPSSGDQSRQRRLGGVAGLRARPASSAGAAGHSPPVRACC